MVKGICIAAMLCAALAMTSCTGAPAGTEAASGSVMADAASGASISSAASAADAASPASTGVAVLADCPIERNGDFGSVNFLISIDDFNALGFAYGDSVDVEFSNGYAATVPYFNGYYGKVGERMLVAYPGSDYVLLAENCGEPMWDVAKLSADDTATITLSEAGAHADVQASFDISYTDERADYASDVVFANFRNLSGGSLAPGTVYRSASPIADEHSRAGYVERLMAEAGIEFVLDLSDDDAEIDAFLAEDAEKQVDTSYFERLRSEGKVVGINLAADYPSVTYAEKLAAGLVALSEHDGPYLVHCIEGKDRTGFTCMLLEALAGASYDEMLADYMTTFDNYYHVNKETDPTRFETIASVNFDTMLEHLPGLEDADVHAAEYVEPARAYLRRGGMTDEQLDALVARITAQA